MPACKLLAGVADKMLKPALVPVLNKAPTVAVFVGAVPPETVGETITALTYFILTLMTTFCTGFTRNEPPSIPGICLSFAPEITVVAMSGHLKVGLPATDNQSFHGTLARVEGNNGPRKARSWGRDLSKISVISIARK